MLIDKVSGRKYKLIIRILYSTGCRVGELINILPKDINFEKQQVFIRKGKYNKTRTTIIFNDPTLC